MRRRKFGFFHASTQNRRTQNRISVLENSEGLSQYEDHQLVNIIMEYFQSIFSTECTGDLSVIN